MILKNVQKRVGFFYIKSQEMDLKNDDHFNPAQAHCAIICCPSDFFGNGEGRIGAITPTPKFECPNFRCFHLVVQITFCVSRSVF